MNEALPIQPKQCQKCLKIKLRMDFKTKDHICQECYLERNREYRRAYKAKCPANAQFFNQSKKHRDAEKKRKANSGVSDVQPIK